MIGAILLALRLLLAAGLYAFLGYALYILWRDLREHARLQAVEQAPTIHLAASLESGDQLFHFQQSSVLIGREALSDCQIEDPTVSNRHTRLSFHHGQWWAEDLRSRNGTFLNGELVLEPIVIVTGDVLRCGQVSVEITLGEHEKDQETRHELRTAS